MPAPVPGPGLAGRPERSVGADWSAPPGVAGVGLSAVAVLAVGGAEGVPRAREAVTARTRLSARNVLTCWVVSFAENPLKAAV